MFQPRPTKFMKRTRRGAGTKAKLIRLATGQIFQHVTMVPHSLFFTMDPAALPACMPIPSVMIAAMNGNKNIILYVLHYTYQRCWGRYRRTKRKGVGEKTAGEKKNVGEVGTASKFSETLHSSPRDAGTGWEVRLQHNASTGTFSLFEK